MWINLLTPYLPGFGKFLIPEEKMAEGNLQNQQTWLKVIEKMQKTPLKLLHPPQCDSTTSSSAVVHRG